MSVRIKGKNFQLATYQCPAGLYIFLLTKDSHNNKKVGEKFKTFFYKKRNGYICYQKKGYKKGAILCTVRHMAGREGDASLPAPRTFPRFDAKHKC